MSARKPLTEPEITAVLDKAEECSHEIRELTKRLETSAISAPIPEPVEAEGRAMLLLSAVSDLLRVLHFRVAMDEQAKKTQADIRSRLADHGDKP